jgi:hypothetical protein
VSDDGDCDYNDEDCPPDDPRLLAVIEQVAPVEVRRVPLLPNRPGAIVLGARSFAPAGARVRHRHRGAHPRGTPSLVAVRHNPTAAGMHNDHAVTRK